ncbi:MAG: glycosyltransferase family 2 protein [Candidatus Bathyarchaeota archaeon]|nr:glycosyltransferase family 2 protein [Candidatus Bathyarchaeum tardum]
MSSKISVIICTYSKKMLADVLACVASVKKQSLEPDEILLVLDPDEDLIKFYQSHLKNAVEVVISDGFGLSFARNMGVKKCNGDVIVFLDDDVIADENWLKNLVTNYDDPDVVGVGGLSKPLWKDGKPLWFPEELYWIIGCSYKGLPKKKALVRNPIGCNMSFRKKVFDEVGFFKTDYGRIGKKLLSDEETEFSIRALGEISNSKIIYDPKAVVHHKVIKSRTTLKYVWNRSFFEGIGKAHLRNKLKKLTPLKTENSYLKFLLTKSIPSRLRHIYKQSNLLQLLTLFFSTFGVFVGFFICYIQSFGAK